MNTINLELPREVIQHEPTPQVPAVVNESVAMLAMIERAALNPAVDIDKMERLMAMHEKMRARQALEAYAQAMSQVQAEIPAIVKDRANTHTSSRYSTLDAIVDGITPVFTKHGFSISYNTYDAPEPGCIGVTCEVMHAGGHATHYKMAVPLDSAGSGGKTNKTGVQAHGSSFTYAKRYLLRAIFNVQSRDDDDDGNGGRDSVRLVTPLQARKIKAELDKCGDDVKAKFAEFEGSPEEVHADQFDAVMQRIRKAQPRKAG